MGNAGFMSSNSIYIHLDKPVVTCGELVSGNIYLNITSPNGFRSRGVYIELEGYEQARFVTSEMRELNVNGELRQERYEEIRNQRRHFLHVRIPIRQFQEQLMPGQYVFPFSFLMPTGLPGTFHESDMSRGWGDYLGQIYYKLEAECDHGGFLGRDVRHAQDLVVHAQAVAQIQPAIVEKNANVKFCCCVDKGQIHMVAKFDKNAYVPGETAYIVVDVDNKSETEIRTLHCKLKRRIALRAHGHRFSKVEVLQDIPFPGVPTGQSRLGEQAVRMELPLTDRQWGQVQPGCRSDLVECEYWLEVECDIPWCPDVTIHLPVVLYHPPREYYMPQAPQGWSPPQNNNYQPYSCQNIQQYSIIGAA